MHARIAQSNDSWVVISYSGEFEDHRKSFNTREEAEHFLTVAGWRQLLGSSWERPYPPPDAFTAVARTGCSLQYWGRPHLSEFAAGKYSLVIGTEVCNWGSFSFFYSATPLETVSAPCDPVLELVGNGHVKIEAVGCWCLEKEAVNMAEFFFRRLEKRYGRELFSEAIHAHFLRNLHREKAR